MGVVNDQHRTELVTECPEPGQVSKIAFHRKDTVCHDPRPRPSPRAVLQTLEHPSEIFHVRMLEHGLADTLLDDGCKTHAVNDAGVVQLIRDDRVPRLTQCREERL